jgi:hypothetical protein
MALNQVKIFHYTFEIYLAGAGHLMETLKYLSNKNARACFAIPSMDNKCVD